ncbi:FG-GAP-like repeat-containing protein [Sorangium sp. So ce131]|uniref:FG-GAP-like repeat-containing protein n=1 Tax=Sorangium sp. So ce131 TaxID=3133282 RepID=UPI003F623F56
MPLSLAWLLLAGCNGPVIGSDGQEVELAETQGALYVRSGATLWTENRSTVPVCWVEPGFDAEKNIIVNALQNTWARYTNVAFTGFGRCPTWSTERFVRVLVHASADGGSGGRAGVGMNATFLRPWQGNSVSIAVGADTPRGRIEYIAVHEFGHVLGFDHEHARPDNPDVREDDPEYCRTDEVSMGGTYATWYDRESTMHYCNSGGNGSGRLSATDIAGAQSVYGRSSWYLGMLDRRLPGVDVNGDGRTDIVHLRDVGGRLGMSVSLSDGAGHVPAWSSDDMPAGSGAVEWLTGDADGDGKTDIFQLWDNSGSLGLIVWRSNGAGYEMYGDTSGVAAGSGAVRFLAADVNNDKRTDIVQLWDHHGTLGMIVHQSDGTRYTTSWSSLMPAGSGAVEWLTGDADGDGKTDVFQLWDNGGSLGLIVWRSSGAGYAMYGDTSGVAAGSGALRFLAADVNNDRRTDIVQLWDHHGTLGMIVHPSDGSRYATSWSSLMPAGAGAVEWLTGDADGDGKTDVFQVWDHHGFREIIIWRSDGIGYQAYSDTSGIWRLGPALQFVAGDVNNDRRTDIIQLWDNVGRLAARTHRSYSTSYLTSADNPDLGAL